MSSNRIQNEPKRRYIIKNDSLVQSVNCQLIKPHFDYFFPFFESLSIHIMRKLPKKRNFINILHMQTVQQAQIYCH